MKTVKEAAAEYAAKERSNRSEHAAFVAGVEFSQRWTHIEEEMPKHKQKVFMKTHSGYVEGGYCEHNAFKHNNGRLCDGVLFWRPIELK
jgi:hypothetical protein